MKYTHEELEAMPAGRDLDGLVAATIFQQTLASGYGGNQSAVVEEGKPLYPVPDYSTDLNAAWLVVVKAEELNEAGKLGPFWFNFWNCLAPKFRTISASSVAAHICRAALIASLPQRSLTEVFAEMAPHFAGVDFSFLEKEA